MKASEREYPACDLCGGRKARLVLVSERLNGPLVRCETCRLYFVAEGFGSSSPPTSIVSDEAPDSAIAIGEMDRLAQRALQLSLVDPRVEESERPWREAAARERVLDLTRFVAHGRLLEVGSSTGEFLSAAKSNFEGVGVEADRGSSRVAVERGLSVFNGTLSEAGFAPGSFDVAVMYHTLEHLPSPAATMLQLRELVQPNGWLVMETPDISTIWFQVLGPRWRQFIPDHRYFFTPETIESLCRRSGFSVRELRSVGKSMSFRLFASRVGRYQKSLGKLLLKLARSSATEDRTLRLRLGDVMRIYATRL